MNDLEHYREAERLLAKADDFGPGDHRLYLVTRAGVHAQLAGVAHAINYWDPAETALREDPK